MWLHSSFYVALFGSKIQLQCFSLFVRPLHCGGSCSFAVCVCVFVDGCRVCECTNDKPVFICVCLWTIYVHVCGYAWVTECLECMDGLWGTERPAKLSASRTWPPHCAFLPHLANGHRSAADIHRSQNAHLLASLPPLLPSFSARSCPPFPLPLCFFHLWIIDSE